jgi:hypothetical protein
MSDEFTSADRAPEIVSCPHCGEQTPKGIYCANCGRALARQPLASDWLERSRATSSTSAPEIDPEPESDFDDVFDDLDQASAAADDSDLPREDEAVDETLEDAAPEFADDGPEVIDGEVLDSIVPYQDDEPETDSRFAPALERTKRLGGNLAKAVSIGGAEGDPIHEALERRGRRPLGDYRRLAGIVVLAVLVSLLLNNAGIAILLSVFLVPVLALLYLTDLDLFEREPWPAILGALGAGAVIGLLFGTIGAWLTGAFWIEGATFYAGAAGYGARFAEAEGSPPIVWILLGGVVIPAIVVIACAIAPVFMRRWPVLRNEIMDGVTLGAATGSGYAAATAVVHFWPAILHGQNPGGDVRTLCIDLAVRH